MFFFLLYWQCKENNILKYYLIVKFYINRLHFDWDCIEPVNLFQKWHLYKIVFKSVKMRKYPLHWNSQYLSVNFYNFPYNLWITYIISGFHVCELISINTAFFKIAFSSHSLWVYGNIINFCILIIYLVTLIHLFVNSKKICCMCGFLQIIYI